MGIFPQNFASAKSIKLCGKIRNVKSENLLLVERNETGCYTVIKLFLLT